MSLSMKINFTAPAKIEQLIAKLGTPLREEVNRQTLYFISDIQKKQMSGRRGEYYLNVQTGHLRRGWFPETQIVAGTLFTRAYTSVPYARIHQYGGVIHHKERQAILSFRAGRAGFVKPSDLMAKGKYKAGAKQAKVTISAHTTRIRKRLFVIEMFELEMPSRYLKAVAKVVKEGRNG